MGTETPDMKMRLDSLLGQWNQGERDAYDELIGLLHEDLARIAHRQFVYERVGHTMQTHDLVSLLYLKLLGSKTIPWTDYNHFLRSAARTMRQILIDHARVWSRRIDGRDRLPMEDMLHFDPVGDVPKILDLLVLEDALAQLEEMDPLTAQIADLKLFLGMNLEEICEELHIPINKAKREWQFVKKFLASKVLKIDVEKGS